MLLASIPPELFRFGGMAVGLLLLFFSLRANKRKRLIDNLPTCKTTGVFIGLVELKGSAEAETPLHSYLAEIPCVHFRWDVQEHWSRTTTETYTDSDGKTQTRTKHESGWTTVASGGEQTIFYLKDDCGVVRVNPAGAKIQADRVFNQHVHLGDPLYYGKGPRRSVSDSDDERQFSEYAVPLHAPVYLMGQSRLRNDVVAPEIADDRDAPIFLISTRSERQISIGLAVQFWVLGVLAVVLATAGWIAGDVSSRDGGLPIGSYIGVFVAAMGVWALGWVWMAYNSMQDLRQRVRQGWSNVDVQLKRRADMIPRLVEVVKGYRKHETDVQEHLARLRSQMGVTAPGRPGEDARGCAPAVMAIREAYPELKANGVFMKLQVGLVDTEQRIALAREYFNSIAAFYNMRLEVVPDGLVCKLGGMKPQPLISAEDFERAPVRVKLTE